MKTMNEDKQTTQQTGRYGKDFGGQYIPETLMTELEKITKAFNTLKDDPDFKAELNDLLINYANRPSLLYYAKNMTEDLGGAKIYLKREDLNHTGAHKINNVIGQALLAKHLGKKRLIAETGAGQHGVATATIAALMGFECEIFMGKEDTDRQKLNVYRMELLGAKVHPVTTGSMVLKDAVNATMQEWARRSDDTLYVLGSAVGPAPFPAMVKHFQSVISKESKKQVEAKEGRLPDMVVACVGGGSNAIGSFADYIDDPSVKLVGVEAAGKGVDTDRTAATIERGSVGIFHGMKSLFMQNSDGQIDPVYSISAGLDYPGVGPEHAALAQAGRAQYVGITDDEAVQAFEYIAKEEGIVAAIESCHAVAYVEKIAPKMSKDQIIVCTLSGRGDKDVASIAKYKGVDIDE
ncbi:tryptophan synthase subunit beta [Lentilactobacillus parafarraginis]|jgi:tryptophan synthase beta chain|uniref:Tryptophan synthase beta chain n=2 Tax=Lentilactobacillus parafarraginis TaxID=390842 RepID=A0A0R1YJE4_9LACO|nr:tryptophan synthase subunit beta [Lentilactobacillus parafarraginis]KRM42471.1 tryptophan synthase, beta subunit [Lentilactobacillus parafarraginis DSM 18390 = JCM 14109]TLQ17909.1 tryptophan synthase subunit beta [Lentilactobacillus parafarraginis]